MSVQWKLKNFLDARGITVYKAAKQTEGKLSRNAWYNLADEPSAVSFDTLSVVMSALEQLTGEDVTVADLITYEVKPEDPKAAEGDALWLNNALTPPQEPFSWGAAGEPEGAPVEFVEGEGLHVYDDQA